MQTCVCSAILAANDTAVKTVVSSAPAQHRAEFLSDCSPRDRPWDVHRSQADQVMAIYSTEEEFGKLAGRMSLCSGVLGFGWGKDGDQEGAQTLKLKSARFCRVRHCPVCQWRRSLMWVARFLEALPRVLREYPTARFLFLTLTRRNLPIENLKQGLKEMNHAWERVRKRKEFAIVQGWVRTTEVTRGRDRSAHPHFHVLLMVPAGYFKSGNYVSQAGWTRIWQEALRSDYDPIVDVRAVKGEDLLSAVRETLKYSVKPGDMVADPDWFLEMTRQLRKLRFVASGGVLKDMLKPEETEQDLLLLGDGEADEPASMFFNWSKPDQRYRRGGGAQ